MPLTAPVKTLASILGNIEIPKLSYSQKLTTHGQKMVSLVMKEKRLLDFIRLFRQHFKDTMKPGFCPYVWDDNPHIYASFGIKPPTKEGIAQALK